MPSTIVDLNEKYWYPVCSLQSNECGPIDTLQNIKYTALIRSKKFNLNHDSVKALEIKHIKILFNKFQVKATKKNKILLLLKLA